MIKQTLFGLIVIAALLLAVVNVSAQEVPAAALAVVLGVAWLALEIRATNPLSSIFMVALVALAVVAALKNASTPLILISLVADLAAWDLSRFGQRIRDEEASESRSRLERFHLQRLALVSGAGFVVALIPVLIQISIQFVGLCLIAIIAAVLLRVGIGSLRGEPKEG